MVVPHSSKRLFASRYIVLILLLGALISADAFIGRNKKKQQAIDLAARRSVEEAARRAKTVVLGGKEFEKKWLYTLGSGFVTALSLGVLLNSGTKKEKERKQ